MKCKNSQCYNSLGWGKDVYTVFITFAIGKSPLAQCRCEDCRQQFCCLSDYQPKLYSSLHSKAIAKSFGSSSWVFMYKLLSKNKVSGRCYYRILEGCLTRYNGGGQKWYELLGFPLSTLYVVNADIFSSALFFICLKLVNDIYHEIFCVFLNGIEWLILFPMYVWMSLSKQNHSRCVSSCAWSRSAFLYCATHTMHTHVMHDRALHSTLFYVYIRMSSANCHFLCITAIFQLTRVCMLWKFIVACQLLLLIQ